MIGSVTLPGAAENLSLLRSSFVALWAVANLVIALLVKIQLSGEKSSKKFSRPDWSWLPTQVLSLTLPLCSFELMNFVVCISHFSPGEY